MVQLAGRPGGGNLLDPVLELAEAEPAVAVVDLQVTDDPVTFGVADPDLGNAVGEGLLLGI